LVRDSNVETVLQLRQFMTGGLEGQAAEMFAGIADPCLALTRSTRLVQQIVALEDKLDQDDETRARRLKEEAEARGRFRCGRPRPTVRVRSPGGRATPRKRKRTRRDFRSAAPSGMRTRRTSPA
jgi:hypothetical protein